MTDIKIRMSKDGGFPVNEALAGLVPMATEVEQAVLTADIRDNEQRDPIILWHGEVIDGRCRQRALTTLGKHILYRELDDKLTEDEVRIFVKSVNTRRNLTSTQKVMTACRESLRDGNTRKLVDIAKSWGISEGLLKNARYIAKVRPEFVGPLFDGSTVKIINQHGVEVETFKVSADYAYIKKAEDRAVENIDQAWREDTYINTQIGKEWYYEQVRLLELVGINHAKRYFAELANYKFTIEAYH